MLSFLITLQIIAGDVRDKVERRLLAEEKGLHKKGNPILE